MTSLPRLLCYFCWGFQSGKLNRLPLWNLKVPLPVGVGKVTLPVACPPWLPLALQQKRLKSDGAITHPCLTPAVTSKPSDSFSTARTLPIMPSWSCLMILVNLNGQPNFARSDHKPVRFMLSNALVGLMNTMYRSLGCSLLFSWNCLSCTENHVGVTAVIATQKGLALWWLSLFNQTFPKILLAMASREIPL